MNAQAPTIAAIATPPGEGGIGIVRVSGPGVPAIARALLDCVPPVRQAHVGKFRDAPIPDGPAPAIDHGIALYFAAPASFTGEDVLELHGHGGPVVQQQLLARVLACGAQLAEPGEFSLRAFLNDKIDLAQAEAIADLISAGSAQAASAAMRSLEGAFSAEVNQLSDQIVHLRTYIEAAIDFPDDEVDFLSDTGLLEQMRDALATLDALGATAERGRLLRDGMTVVIAGAPNAGKSSLLNQLAGVDAAIVADVPGTTRDVLREHIHLDGMPLHVIDTAGLRASDDQVEREGVARARKEIAKADRILLVRECSPPGQQAPVPDVFVRDVMNAARGGITQIDNKIDLIHAAPGAYECDGQLTFALSARTGEGVALLREHLKQAMGFVSAQATPVIARARHIAALVQTRAHLAQALEQLQVNQAGELAAEELRLAHQALCTITGQFTTEDLLGEIFSSFCIGK